jgi:hypothetical protein
MVRRVPSGGSFYAHLPTLLDWLSNRLASLSPRPTGAPARIITEKAGSRVRTASRPRLTEWEQGVRPFGHGTPQNDMQGDSCPFSAPPAVPSRFRGRLNGRSWGCHQVSQREGEGETRCCQPT